MADLKKLKAIIKETDPNGSYRQIFDTRNIVGDPMHNVYLSEGVRLDVCHYYGYFEVFGLTDKEFKELEEYVENR